MLHIHNGDVSADTARSSSLPGEHLAFREALIGGPTPSGLTATQWRETRAKHLSEAYGANKDEYAQNLLDQDEKLASFEQHDEVVLWFEYDLFCQVHLIYLLDWFAKRDIGNTKLSLICIGEFPGKQNFRGLGELNSDELASLFPARQPVSSQQLDLASAAWRAYCSADPNDVQTILASDTACLPFLGPALKAHLQRFPSKRNGLGQIENRGLDLIESGSKRFVDLFSRFGTLETVYGLGDLQLWESLRRMSDADQPLIIQKEPNENATPVAPEVLRKAKFEVTPIGRSVLKGDSDFVKLNGIDQWLGGVHLVGNTSGWRWDETVERVVSG